MSGALVTAAWLKERLHDPRVRVVDCRWKLGEPGAGEPLWRAAHIPGAAFLDLDRDLAGPPGPRGRHPLPAAADFEQAARRAGIGAGTLVVAYDEAGEGGAARLWWLLRHFGHPEAAVLDGGLRGWRAEAGPLRGGPEEIEPGDFTARPREDDTAELAEEAARGDADPAAGDPARGGGDPPAGDPARGGGPPAGDPARGDGPPAGDGAARLLLDARSPERFRGEREPVDPVAGHIPGAANLPFAGLAPDGHFLAPAELRARLEAAGAAPDRELVAYCGSGVTACVLVLATEVAGLAPARLYPGSWSEWSGRGLPAG